MFATDTQEGLIPSLIEEQHMPVISPQGPNSPNRCLTSTNSVTGILPELYIFSFHLYFS